MKYAKFSDEFLSNFRLDDKGETLVLTDKRGYTRALKLLNYEDRPQGEWLYMATPNGLLLQCDKCKHFIKSGTDKNFCPNCGADMRGIDNG